MELSNYVTRKTAQQKLIQLRSIPCYREKFTSLSFYVRVRSLMGRYVFNVPVRRFVSELFAHVDWVSSEAWGEVARAREEEGGREEEGR